MSTATLLQPRWHRWHPATLHRIPFRQVLPSLQQPVKPGTRAVSSAITTSVHLPYRAVARSLRQPVKPLVLCPSSRRLVPGGGALCAAPTGTMTPPSIGSEIFSTPPELRTGKATFSCSFQMFVAKGIDGKSGTEFKPKKCAQIF